VSLEEDIGQRINAAKRLRERNDANEGTTVISLVTPMLRSLGYDTGDPDQVMSQYRAGLMGQKDNAVDYAIFTNGEPAIYIECKTLDHPFDKKDVSQLARYFGSTLSVKLGILTDGIRYRFYSDIDHKNVMDKEPFFVMDLEKYTPNDLELFGQYHKSVFDIDKIRSNAENNLQMEMVVNELRKEMETPSDEITTIIAQRLRQGVRITQSVRSEYVQLIKEAYERILQNHTNSLLDMAIKKSREISKAPPPPPNPQSRKDQAMHVHRRKKRCWVSV
jgi:hypothetical protein